MKKIWLRKEREDSKFQSESKSESADGQEKSVITSNLSCKDEANLPHSLPVTELKSNGDNEEIPEYVFRMKTSVYETSSKESNSGSSRDAQNSVSTSLFQESGLFSGAYPGSFYSSLDAAPIHPAYVLAIRQNDLSSLVHGSIDPYQLQRQQLFAVQNALSFLPMTQIKKYGINGSHYDSSQAIGYDPYVAQSCKDDSRFSSHPNENGHGPSQSKFDYSPFYYPLTSSSSLSEKHSQYFYHLLNRNPDLCPNGKPQLSLKQAEPFVPLVRKRAPNSPLEVPITPTTKTGNDPSASSIFSRAFVVPRNMMRLSNGEEESKIFIEGAKKAEKLLPTMIANMSELEVGDEDDRPSISSRKNSREALEECPYPVDSVPNFRPYDTLVMTSSSSLGGIQQNGKTGHHQQQHASKTGQRLEIRGKVQATEKTHNGTDANNNHSNVVNRNSNNGINNIISVNSHVKSNNTGNINKHNDNSTGNSLTIKDSRSLRQTEKRQPPSIVALSSDDSQISSSDVKEHSTATTIISTSNSNVVSTTLTPPRGKGRPAKALSKPGSETPSSSSPSSGGGGILRSVIKCPTCMKVFNNSSALAKHKLTHSDERKYSCQLCSKAFKRQDHLNGHMMTHSSKKPFECKFLGCTKSYCDARSLRRHLENHHHDSINSCNGTSQALAQTGSEGHPVPQVAQPDSCSLAQFSDDHWNSKVVWAPGFNPLDEPKPVRCHVCGRRFKNVPALNGHMRLHGGYTNRDPEEGIAKTGNQPGDGDLLISVGVPEGTWDSDAKTYEGRGIPPHVELDHLRASSLECLPSLRESSILSACSLTKEELERIKSKSNSLPREEVKSRSGCPEWGGNHPGGDAGISHGGSRYASMNSKESNMADRMNALSGTVIDLTKDKRVGTSYDGNNNNGNNFNDNNNNDNNKNTISKTNKTGVHPCEPNIQTSDSKIDGKVFNASRSIGITHLSKHLHFENSGKFSRTEAKEATGEREVEIGSCPDRSSKISPKHLEASSLYQRRLRRFSERSPNSDESSRQSTTDTSSPPNPEVFSDKEDSSVVGKHLLPYNEDRLSRSDVIEGSKHNNSLAAPASQKDLEALKTCFPSKLPPLNTDLRHNQDKIHSSHPSLFQTYYHQQQDLSKIHPINPLTAAESCFKSNNSSSSIHMIQYNQGTPTESNHINNNNTIPQHQQSLHSSLPCTPYTAHTPYTPRTTEPVSPRQASFFQFPPFHQPEGATPEGSKVVSMDAPSFSTFDPESAMETARIPEVHGGSRADLCHSERAGKKQGCARRDVEEVEKGNTCPNTDVALRKVITINTSDESARLNYLKARGKIIEQNETESANSHEKQKEKLSDRRKLKPAPLVLPPQKEAKERFVNCQNQTKFTPRGSCAILSGNDDPVLSPSFPSSSSSSTSNHHHHHHHPLSRSSLKSSVSSVDSGCPKSSSRFSADGTPQCGFTLNARDSLVTDENGDAAVLGSKRSGKSETTKEHHNHHHLHFKMTIKIGSGYQALIPKIEANRCGQKEKAELCLPSKKDWSEAMKGSNWSEREIQQFSRALSSFNKDFALISKTVGSRSIKECIQFYYTWKKRFPRDYMRHKIMRRSGDRRRRFMAGVRAMH